MPPKKKPKGTPKYTGPRPSYNKPKPNGSKPKASKKGQTHIAVHYPKGKEHLYPKNHPKYKPKKK